MKNFKQANRRAHGQHERVSHRAPICQIWKPVRPRFRPGAPAATTIAENVVLDVDDNDDDARRGGGEEEMWHTELGEE